MAEMKRIEVGFSGGQVMSARVTTDTLKDLREAVERRTAGTTSRPRTGP